MLRVAFVGCGNIAGYHVKAAAKTARVQITALVDPDASALQAFRETLSGAEGATALFENAALRCFSSLAEALAADAAADGGLFDACDIMAPSFLVGGVDLHESLAGESMRAGKHTLLEKPITVSSEAARRLIKLHASVAPSKVLAVAENSQFWPEVLEARACITRGDIGEVLQARAKYWESARGEWAGDYLPGTWRCDEAKLPSASFTYDGATHWIRPLRLWLGEVRSVCGVTGVALPHMAGVSCSQHVFKFASGRSAVFESILAPEAISDQPFFTVQGSRGEIVVDGFEGGCRCYLPEGKGTKVTELCKQGWDEGYNGEYHDFVAACLDGVATANPPGEALQDLLVVHAMFEAAERECWVCVGDTAA